MGEADDVAAGAAQGGIRGERREHHEPAVRAAHGHDAVGVDLGVVVKPLDAGVDIVGIANFVTFLENTGDWRREHREAEYGSLDEDRAFLESISPINNVDQIASPLFVLHGANDPRVPVGEAEQIVETAREQGVPVRKLIFDDEGHGFSKRDNRIEAYRAVDEFLDEHVLSDE